MNDRERNRLAWVGVKPLDVRCRQKFKSNAQKLGEWIAASHVERVATAADGRTPAPTPTSPPPNP